MKRLLCAVSTFGFLGLATSVSFAADPYVDLGYDWSGFYAGAYAGYVWGNVDADVLAGGPSLDFDIKGVKVGALSGYNWQMDSWVFGLEHDTGFLDVDGVSAVSGGGQINDFDVETDGRIRARIGWARDNFLPFVAGGLSLANTDARVIGLGGGADSKWHVGFNIGAGVDVGITEHLVGRLEYIYDNYGNERYTYPGGQIDIDWDSHTVRAAAIWNF